MRLTTIPWLGKLGKSLWNFGEDADAAEQQREVKRELLIDTIERADALGKLADSHGYKMFVASIQERLEALRNELETDGCDIKMVRARIDELKAALRIVSDGIGAGDGARLELLRIEE